MSSNNYHHNGSMMLMTILSFLTLTGQSVVAFVPTVPSSTTSLLHQRKSDKYVNNKLVLSLSNTWNGEVVPNEGGTIRGCSVTPVGDSVTEWIITIDGIEADLGRFSQAIYKKITMDAKQQQFQGFRPGTIPPHLKPTYRAFAMDECARETVLEAMQQNNIRPFADARQDMVIENCSIPPPIKKTRKKKSKKRKKTNKTAEGADVVAEAEPKTEPQWLVFDDMKGAIDAGWEPGQSFSFIAKHVRGQKVLSDEDVSGAQPLGLNY